MPNFRVVNLEQGSAEWLNWRRSGIGASDAPTVMGENRWKSANVLRAEKSDPNHEPFVSDAMLRGTNLESSARREYNTRYDIDMVPMCLESVERPWMKCSVDGISIDRSIVLEIKCGESSFKYTRKTGKVPDYYYGQLQHILSITGFGSIDYWSYLPLTSPILLQVSRDEHYIAKLVKSVDEFWLSIASNSSHGTALGS